MYRQRQALKTYDLHPVSIKQITKGHPWITLDKFSEKFPAKDRFIVAANRKRPFALLIHDPSHKYIRARVWATGGDFQKQMKNFKNDLQTRIRNAINKRVQNKVGENRNHFYLIFGENDQIPGLKVHYLNGEILIQFYTDFWTQYKDFIVQNVMKVVQEKINEDVYHENIWIQVRGPQKQPAISLDPNCHFRSVEISEYGVKYKVVLGKYYDHGIYTDMASVRGKIKEELEKSKSLLNLFSYTGAFSLYAMSLGVQDVVSVDLSESYIEWLEQNIALNEDFKEIKHTSLTQSVEQSLGELNEAGTKFDFIISDPPSSSSDKNKRSNSLDDYKKYLPLIDNALTKNGKALVFLNTHKTSMRKFEDRILKIIEEQKLPLKITKKFYLSEDCPYKKGFPEGNYLKGLLLVKNDQG